MRGVAGIKKAAFPSINDRKLFWKFVIAKKAYDLLQNRVSKKAYDDRAEDGVIVPGISVFEKFGISIRKRGR